MPNASAQQGSTIAEYGILLALVAGVSLYGLQTLGPAFIGNFKNVGNVGTLSLLAPLGEKGRSPSSAEENSKFPTPVSPPPIFNNPGDITVDQPRPLVGASPASEKTSNYEEIVSIESTPNTVAGGLGSQVTEAEKEPTAPPSPKDQDNAKKQGPPPH